MKNLSNHICYRITYGWCSNNNVDDGFSFRTFIREKDRLCLHTSFLFIILMLTVGIVCCFSLVSSQILQITKKNLTKKAFHLISSIFSPIIFLLFSIWLRVNFKKKRTFFLLWKESMQIIPLNSFIIYADFFFCGVYILFIVHVNVSKW